MKKILKVICFVALIFIISGCDNKKEVMKTCTVTSNNTVQGYKMENEYKVYGTGKVVDKVVTTEIVTSDDESILNYLEEFINSTYEATNSNYGGYTYTVERKDNKVIAKTTIDYNKMNLEKYVEDNSIMKNYVNSDNKLLVEGIIKLYESMGATCK